MANNCNRKDCKFKHDINACRDYYYGNCNNKNCKLSHNQINKLNNEKNTNNRNSNRRNFKNTETFEPNYSPPDMRVLFEYGKNKCELSITDNDIIIVSDLFIKDHNIYNQLLKEVFDTNFNKQELIKPWHEGCHLIVDDHLNWKKDCPTFNYIVSKIADYFNMDIQATRFNWYQNKSDWKAYHFDAAAFDEKKAKIQNFTVGVSFGATRDIAFQVANHPNCRNVVSFPMKDGTTFCFSKDVNINWRHGILPLKVEDGYVDKPEDGRISIIAWGKITI